MLCETARYEKNEHITLKARWEWSRSNYEWMLAKMAGAEKYKPNKQASFQIVIILLSESFTMATYGCVCVCVCVTVNQIDSYMKRINGIHTHIYSGNVCWWFIVKWVYLSVSRDWGYLFIRLTSEKVKMTHVIVTVWHTHTFTNEKKNVYAPFSIRSFILIRTLCLLLVFGF